MNPPKVNLARKTTRRDTTAGLLQPFVASGTTAKRFPALESSLIY
jgi:hypothetical protein